MFTDSPRGRVQYRPRNYRSITEGDDDDYTTAHEKLFSEGAGYCLNLRTLDDERRCIYMLTLGRPVLGVDFFGVRRNHVVYLTDMVPDVINKPKCMLVRNSDDEYLAKYSGSHNDGMGNVVKYEMYVRTDVTSELRAKQVVARAQVIRSERLDRFLAQWQTETWEYDIYSAQWENNENGGVEEETHVTP